MTKNVHPLRAALFNLVGGEYPTYVWKAGKGHAAGFIQIQLEEKNEHYAHILCLGASTRGVIGVEHSEMEQAWLPLLDQAVFEVGRRGIHSLVAEVNEAGDELPVLRQAGFAVYTRQDIWALEKQDGQSETAVRLTTREAADDWEIQLLYANTVPRLVQLVEPTPPMYNDTGWVMREQDELTAFVHIQQGEVGTWMRLFIHPNAETRSEAILAAALNLISNRTNAPIYTCVRRYQSWLQGTMERAGFVLWGSQAVMVKHTVHHLYKPIPEITTAVDAKHIPVSTPMVRQYRQPTANGKIKHSHS